MVIWIAQKKNFEICSAEVSHQTFPSDSHLRFVIRPQKDHRIIGFIAELLFIFLRTEFTSYLTYALSLAPFSVEVPVAFSTRLQGYTNIDDSPVIFEIVDLNIGDGYDEFTGNLIRDISFMFHFEETKNENSV